MRAVQRLPPGEEQQEAWLLTAGRGGCSSSLASEEQKEEARERQGPLPGAGRVATMAEVSAAPTPQQAATRSRSWWTRREPRPATEEYCGGDEALAHALQLQEVPEGLRSQPDDRPQADRLSDAELALLLQAQENEAARSLAAQQAARQQQQPQQLGPEPAATGGTPPAGVIVRPLAPRPQQQPVQALPMQQEQPQRPPTPSPPPPRPRSPTERRRQRLQGANSLEQCGQIGPYASAFLGSGYFLGCAGACQVASFFSLGNCVTGLCMLGGAVAGHLAQEGGRFIQSNQPIVGRRRPQRRAAAADSSDSSDEELPEEELVQRGLSHQVIVDNTVEHRFTGNAAGGESPNSDNDENKCMICMEGFANGDELRTLPCLHRYHTACIDEWLGRSKECPICRVDLTAAPDMPLSPHNSDEGRLGWLRSWRQRG